MSAVEKLRQAKANRPINQKWCSFCKKTGHVFRRCPERRKQDYVPETDSSGHPVRRLPSLEPGGLP